MKYNIFNFLTILNVLALLIVVLFIIVIYIDYKISLVPKWVDEKLHGLIKKKSNSPVLSKFAHILVYFIPINRLRNNVQFELFCDWTRLEKDLDDLVEKIRSRNLDIDIIVGIKSGGAIITKYVAEKLDIDYDYIKISERKFNCEKTPYDTFVQILTGQSYERNLVCEEVTKNIEGKNVLILDEQISTGQTIEGVAQYLQTKKVKKIYSAVICKTRADYSFDVMYVKKYQNYCVWPWGYDN
jgi:hypoxanthine phosphoribosyltransferase